MRSSIALLVLAAALLAGRAEANPGFPTEIARHLNLTCSPPDCTLCHNSDVGQCGTVTHPLGQWLMSEGLTCASGSVYQVDAIDPILDQARATQVDSNCDGTPDIDQLTACDWGALAVNQCGAPPGGGGHDNNAQNVIYGCTTPPGPLVPGTAALGIALGLVLIARKRRANPVTPRSVREED